LLCFITKEKRESRKLKLYVCDVVDDCYRGSNLIDGRRCIREPERIRRDFAIFKFSLFCAFAVARDTKSGRMVVLENFDRLQLCSFSFSSRCSSRKTTLACTRLRAYPFLIVILQLTEIYIGAHHAVIIKIR